MSPSAVECPRRNKVLTGAFKDLSLFTMSWSEFANRICPSGAITAASVTASAFSESGDRMRTTSFGAGGAGLGAGEPPAGCAGCAGTCEFLLTYGDGGFWASAYSDGGFWS